MVNMTLSVPHDLKLQMDEFPVINWSEVAREAFAEKIRELGLLKSITAKSRLTEKDVMELAKKINAAVAKRHEE